MKPPKRTQDYVNLGDFINNEDQSDFDDDSDFPPIIDYTRYSMENFDTMELEEFKNPMADFFFLDYEIDA